MTAIDHLRAAFERHPTSQELGHRSTYLRLRASGDGWSLIKADGTAVYRGLGLRARRECLEFARDEGILAILGGSGS